MVIRWAARILAIFFILFIGMFSLDVFSGGAGFWQTLAAFLIHNIPAFILAGMLWIAWTHPKIGGIGFLLCGVGLFFLVRHMGVPGRLLFCSPLWVTGLLFLFTNKPKRS